MMGCGSSLHQRSSRNSIKINVIEPTSIAPEPSDIEPYSLRRESSNGVHSIPEEEQNNMASTTTSKRTSFDAMISYHASDADFVKYLSGELKKNKIKVWMPDSSASNKSQGIVDSKVFLIILSRESASSKTCQDEVALAYISNKSIFPVAREQFAALSGELDFGMRLTLSKLNWIFFESDADRKENFPLLLSAMRMEMDRMPEEDEDAEAELNFKMNYQRRHYKSKTSTGTDFWERNFASRNEVPWTEFRDTFVAEYNESLVNDFTEDKIKWVMNLIYKDVLELRKSMDKKSYITFCGPSKGEHDGFYERLKDYTVGALAIREVFDMQSSVRLGAVQNLGQFKTPSVIAALMDLLDDPDPNMKAVAAIALSKTGVSNKKVIDRLIKLLDDEDRLVRESACISLGHIQAEEAVPHIMDLWRNDAISHVRAAAEIALTLIGGEKSEEAIKITQVLGKEMKSLSKNK